MIYRVVHCLLCESEQDGVHFGYCPSIKQPPQSAYDRAQTELTARIAALTLSQETLEKRFELANADNRLVTQGDALLQQGQLQRDTLHRLDAALRRIEALELEVARLKGPQALAVHQAECEHMWGPNGGNGNAYQWCVKCNKCRHAPDALPRDANGTPLPDEVVNAMNVMATIEGIHLPDEGT